MKRQKPQILCSTIGNEKKFPVIKSLVGLFNEHFNNNEYTYCTNMLGEYNKLINGICVISDLKMRAYLMGLVKEKFLQRLSIAKLSEKIHSHMCNLIMAIHNEKVY